MRIRHLILLLAAVITAFLAFAPTRVTPVRWQPPPAPSQDSGPYARNEGLQGVTRLGAGRLDGPEGLVIDARGGIVTGLADSHVVRLDPSTGKLSVLARTDGRPLGLALHPDGRIVIADAVRGLLAVTPDSRLQVLADAAGPLPLGFTDDVTVSRDGRHAWFSDASQKWGYGHDAEAVMEHGGDGRLLRHDFRTGRSEVMLTGLQFANGVALGPDERFVLVNETGAYRITRLWLKGPKAGQRDVFIDNLPGLPDNLSFNGRDRFWVALYAPRNPLLDGLADWPSVRKVVSRALQVLPKPVEHRAMVLGLDTDGRVMTYLEDRSRGNYSPITTVREHQGQLYLGSLHQDSVGRLARPRER